MGPQKREPGEVLSPVRLAAVQILSFHEPLQIHMVVPDVELMLGSFQIVVPLLQGADDREHLLVRHWIVPFLQTHGMRGKGDRMPFVVFENGEDHAGSEVRSVHFESELTVIVGISKNGSGGKTGFQTCEHICFCTSPCKGLVFLHKVCEGLCEHCIVFYESSVEVGKAKEAADAAHRCGHGPLRDGFYLAIVHANAILVDKHP